MGLGSVELDTVRARESVGRAEALVDTVTVGVALRTQVSVNALQAAPALQFTAAV